VRRSTSTVRISPPRVSSLRLTSRPSQREGESKLQDLSPQRLIVIDLLCARTVVFWRLDPGD
jgi:hypothetical protein